MPLGALGVSLGALEGPQMCLSPHSAPHGAPMEKGWVHMGWDPIKTKALELPENATFLHTRDKEKVPDLLYCVPKWPKVPKPFSTENQSKL